MGFIKQSRYYMPRSDPGKREWFNNFADIVASDPSAVGLGRADADRLVRLAKQFDEAYVRANRPGSRSQAATGDKNEIRAQAKKTFENYAMRIKCMGFVGNEKKVELGIHVDKGSRDPIAAPRYAPILAVDYATPGSHRLRWYDPARPNSKAKPFGVVHLEVRMLIDGQATNMLELMERATAGEGRMHLATRHVFDVPHEARDAGRTATYVARWVTERGLTGPWSSPVAMTIISGGKVHTSGGETRRSTPGNVHTSGGETRRSAPGNRGPRSEKWG